MTSRKSKGPADSKKRANAARSAKGRSSANSGRPAKAGRSARPANAANHGTSGRSAPPRNSGPSASSGPSPTADAALSSFLEELRAFRKRLDPGRKARHRQGPEVDRSSSPAWDMTGLRVRRVDKARFVRFVSLLATADRTPPHWEAFALWVKALEDALPERLRPLVADPPHT